MVVSKDEAFRGSLFYGAYDPKGRTDSYVWTITVVGVAAHPGMRKSKQW